MPVVNFWPQRLKFAIKARSKGNMAKKGFSFNFQTFLRSGESEAIQDFYSNNISWLSANQLKTSKSFNFPNRYFISAVGLHIWLWEGGGASQVVKFLQFIKAKKFLSKFSTHLSIIPEYDAQKNFFNYTSIWCCTKKLKYMHMRRRENIE